MHNNEVPPVGTTVKFFNNYLKSIGYTRKYSVDEILKGKMSVEEEGPLFHVPAPALILPLSPPPVDHVALSLDGSFSSRMALAPAGIIICAHDVSVILTTYCFIIP